MFGRRPKLSTHLSLRLCEIIEPEREAVKPRAACQSTSEGEGTKCGREKYSLAKSFCPLYVARRQAKMPVILPIQVLSALIIEDF